MVFFSSNNKKEGCKVVEAKLSKKDQTQQWLLTHNLHEWGLCTHCQSVLKLEQYTLVCPFGHRFDSAKQGYYHLTSKQLAPTKYDQELFKARRKIIQESTLYHPLHDFVTKQLQKKKAKIIVDAGSGEGSHLARLISEIPYALTGLAFDLSKPGIQMSTDYNQLFFSAVSDLANLPIQKDTVDVILSILSPANYDEFNRVLKSDGFVIKVVPNSGYLKEIREGLSKYQIKDVSDYNNNKVIEVFSKHYPKHQQHIIKEVASLSHEQIRQLLDMTPLAWNLSTKEKEVLSKQISNQITLDVTVLISK